MAASEAWAERTAAAIVAAAGRGEADVADMRTCLDFLAVLPHNTKSVAETLKRLRAELDRQAP